MRATAARTEHETTHIHMHASKQNRECARAKRWCEPAGSGPRARRFVFRQSGAIMNRRVLRWQVLTMSTRRLRNAHSPSIASKFKTKRDAGPVRRRCTSATAKSQGRWWSDVAPNDDESSPARRGEEGSRWVASTCACRHTCGCSVNGAAVRARCTPLTVAHAATVTADVGSTIRTDRPICSSRETAV